MKIKSVTERLLLTGLILLVSVCSNARNEKSISGHVLCEGEGIPGVVVSDGISVSRTDKNGYYELKSDKKYGYVFISIPSGFAVGSSGVLPQFYKYLDSTSSRPEKKDFNLIREDNQINHKVVFIGDIQLARRSGDIEQFRRFTDELSSLVTRNEGTKFFAVTLGDMTWDSHWLSGPYNFKDYLNDISGVGHVQIFHAMGNHDHELEAAGDFDTSEEFRKYLGPSYYSFNVGEIHYIVLDDIESTNDGSGKKATYLDRLVEDQLEWLKKDLSFVPVTTPLVVVLHAPIYRESGRRSLDNAEELTGILSGYRVYVQSGHKHILYNVDKTSENGIFEQVSGSVCATWWYTGHNTPWLHIARDGSPGGYRVCEITGKEFKSYFKGIERDSSFQFRSYDRNSILIDADSYAPKADSEHRWKFESTLGEYATPNSENWIYVNVWDWDPMWSISIIEEGKPLKVEQYEACDPLHLIAYNAKRADINKSLSFPTKETGHFFRARASSPDTDVRIVVKDRYGNTYSETMKRPRAFSIEEYL